MPRLARLDAPGALHHIMIRGIERRAIFRSDQDRRDFLKRLAVLLPESQTQCYAWVLMKNHVHLLLRSGVSGISQLMRRLLTGYAVYFNRRYRRHGQLFQNRFKSIICQEDVYFKELVRYIHLNPVRAKVVGDIGSLDGYSFCGHSALMGKQKRPWQQNDYVLSYFGKSVSDARKRYLEYVQSGFNQGRRPELTGGGLIKGLGGWKVVRKIRLKGQDRVKSDVRILGDSDFVTRILEEANEKLDRHYELKSRGYDLTKVEERVMEIFGIKRDVIYSSGRRQQQMQARSLFCHWAVDELGMSRTEIARCLGMTQPGVGYAVNRGAQIAQSMNYKLIY
ncbi:MAG: transposase [Desulfobacterales bacterium]|nr:transposase [Desulfobacterales bacterium]